jgi:hypothetical protein
MGDEILDGLDGRHRDKFVAVEPPNGAPTDPHESMRPSSGTVAVPLAEEVEPEGPPTDLEKYPARDILDPTPVESEFEEGPPRHHDPSVDAFKKNFAEVLRLEEQISPEEARLEGISSAEAELEQKIELLVKEQILAVYRGWKPVAEGKVSQDVVDTFLLEAGIKRHGNEKIPCSPFMRVIVAHGEIKGTRRSKRKKKRAATHASAVDYVIRVGMTEEEFEAELRHPPTPGERHGIEHLAELGRAARRAAKLDGDPVLPQLDMPFTIEGDFSGVQPGDHLMLARPQGDTAKQRFAGWHTLRVGALYSYR